MQLHISSVRKNRQNNLSHQEFSKDFRKKFTSSVTLNRGTKADLSLLKTLLAIYQKLWDSSFCKLMGFFVLLIWASFAFVNLTCNTWYIQGFWGDLASWSSSQIQVLWNFRLVFGLISSFNKKIQLILVFVKNPFLMPFFSSYILAFSIVNFAFHTLSWSPIPCMAQENNQDVK